MSLFELTDLMTDLGRAAMRTFPELRDSRRLNLAAEAAAPLPPAAPIELA